MEPVVVILAGIFERLLNKLEQGVQAIPPGDPPTEVGDRNQTSPSRQVPASPPVKQARPGEPRKKP